MIPVKPKFPEDRKPNKQYSKDYDIVLGMFWAFIVGIIAGVCMAKIFYT